MWLMQSRGSPVQSLHKLVFGERQHLCSLNMHLQYKRNIRSWKTAFWTWHFTQVYRGCAWPIALDMAFYTGS